MKFKPNKLLSSLSAFYTSKKLKDNAVEGIENILKESFIQTKVFTLIIL
jgi:hypothetical protein